MNPFVILNAHVSIKEISNERWDISDFWVNGEPGNVVEGKTYSKIGAFVENYDFEPIEINEWRTGRLGNFTGR